MKVFPDLVVVCQLFCQRGRWRCKYSRAIVREKSWFGIQSSSCRSGSQDFPKSSPKLYKTKKSQITFDAENPRMCMDRSLVDIVQHSSINVTALLWWLDLAWTNAEEDMSVLSLGRGWNFSTHENVLLHPTPKLLLVMRHHPQGSGDHRCYSVGSVIPEMLHGETVSTDETTNLKLKRMRYVVSQHFGD